MQPSIRVSFAAAITLSLLSACHGRDPAAPVEESLKSVCARLDSAVATFSSYVTPDAQAAAVAATIPGGFGGFTHTPEGTPAIFLVEPARFAAATATARRAMACASAGRVMGVLAFVSGSSVVLPGRYDYAALVRWYAQVSNNLGDVAREFVFSDVTEDENRLTFGMATAAAAERLRVIVAGLGIPAAAINVVVAPWSGFARAGG
jgi:hypothetical protein